MSSGEPIKRQKVEFKETSQTVKSFPSVKHENKPDTLTLNQENARLNAENNRLNEFISKHNSAWARLVKDIRTLCQAYSYEKCNL